MRKISLILLITVLSIGLSACGGSKKKVAAAEGGETALQSTTDITRPPQIAKDRGPIEAESNPDETISFDEWRRRRQAEIEGKDP